MELTKKIFNDGKRKVLKERKERVENKWIL